MIARAEKPSSPKRSACWLLHATGRSRSRVNCGYPPVNGRPRPWTRVPLTKYPRPRTSRPNRGRTQLNFFIAAGRAPQVLSTRNPTMLFVSLEKNECIRVDRHRVNQSRPPCPPPPAKLLQKTKVAASTPWTIITKSPGLSVEKFTMKKNDRSILFWGKFPFGFWLWRRNLGSQYVNYFHCWSETELTCLSSNGFMNQAQNLFSGCQFLITWGMTPRAWLHTGVPQVRKAMDRGKQGNRLPT